MTTRELKIALRELGWTQAELARQLDLYPTTLSRWITEDKIPGFVRAYLALALGVHRLGDVLRPAR